MFSINMIVPEDGRNSSREGAPSVNTFVCDIKILFVHYIMDTETDKEIIFMHINSLWSIHSSRPTEKIENYD